MKYFLKQVVNKFFGILTWPLYVLFCIHKRWAGGRRALSSITQACAIVPGMTGEWFRRGVLQWVTGAPLQNCCLGYGAIFSDPRVRIGEGVYIGPRSDIGYASIGRDCILGSGVHIVSGQHQHLFSDQETPIRDQGGVFSQITIGPDTWVGNAAVVAADIGGGCVIGAGSVVIKPIPARSVAAGNPARVLRSR